MARVPIKITGLGILNGLGMGKDSYWRQLLNGSWSIAPVGGLAVPVRKAIIGSRIRDFDPKAFMPPRFYRRLSRLSRLAVAASIEAVRDGALDISDHNRQRTGAVFGTAFGSTHQTDSFFASLLENGPQAAEPILFPDTVPNAPAGHVAIYHQLQGPNSTFCQNHLSGECALAFAVSLIELGRADTLLVGGVDEASDILLHSLDAIGALRPLPRSGGFDPRRMAPGKGFIPGEGATCLVLDRDETEGNEKSENKRAYGVASAVAVTGAQAPPGRYESSGEGIFRAMEAAMEEAELKPDEIDLIGLSANGVRELENVEALALDKAFGRDWRAIPRIPLRYFVGEFGTAGLLTVATVLLALQAGVLPPHVQGESLTGEVDDAGRFSPARKATLRHAMVIGSTFGGGSSCLIMSRRG